MYKIIVLVLVFFINCSKMSDNKLTEKNAPHSFHFKQSELSIFFEQNDEYNTEITMFIDLNRASNKKRFFVYSHKEKRTILSALVTHGSCDGETAPSNEKYSNIPDSHCSSLGKYKIGKSYYGKFGLAYKLHGLEESNSNAYNRSIVLHSHTCVPNRERAFPICVSQGCPTVSPDFLKRISPIIDASKKPILLWIYNSTPRVT